MMRYAILALLVGLALPTAAAHAQPVGTTVTACYGVPAPVHAAPGGGVTAGRVDVRCAGRWTAFQGVLWFSSSADQYGKWSYGGTRNLTGHGDTVIRPWTRPYHGCGWWKQEWRMAGSSRFSQVEWFCA